MIVTKEDVEKEAGLYATKGSESFYHILIFLSHLVVNSKDKNVVGEFLGISTEEVIVPDLKVILKAVHSKND